MYCTYKLLVFRLTEKLSPTVQCTVCYFTIPKMLVLHLESLSPSRLMEK